MTTARPLRVAPLVASFCLALGVAKAATSDIFSVPASNILAAVSAQYDAITNLSCTVRRETSDGQGGTLETMSRVDWARGDKMRVQVLKGGGRRVVIDGTSVFVKYPGEEAPAKYLVENQTPTQFANLRSVPSSPMETLAPLAGIEARDIDAPVPFARAVAFGTAGDDITATLFIDAEGRAARLDFASKATDGAPPAETSTFFRAPVEALPGVWLFRRVETEAKIGEEAISAVARFDRVEVNGEMPDTMFDPAFNF